MMNMPKALFARARLFKRGLYGTFCALTLALVAPAAPAAAAAQQGFASPEAGASRARRSRQVQ